MTTYTFEITMSEEALAELTRKAMEQKAPTIGDYVRVLIEKDVRTDKQPVSASGVSVAPIPSLEEILAPVHRQVEASGISDEELDSLFETLRNEVYQEKQAAKRPAGQTA